MQPFSVPYKRNDGPRLGGGLVVPRAHTKEHTVITQVIDNKRMTPILGMNFCKPHDAVFDMKPNHITIETEEEDGSVTQEVVKCWCQDATAETEAALQQQH